MVILNFASSRFANKLAIDPNTNVANDASLGLFNDNCNLSSFCRMRIVILYTKDMILGYKRTPAIVKRPAPRSHLQASQNDVGRHGMEKGLQCTISY